MPSSMSPLHRTLQLLESYPDFPTPVGALGAARPGEEQSDFPNLLRFEVTHEVLQKVKLKADLMVIACEVRQHHQALVRQWYVGKEMKDYLRQLISELLQAHDLFTYKAKFGGGPEFKYIEKVGAQCRKNIFAAAWTLDPIMKATLMKEIEYESGQEQSNLKSKASFVLHLLVNSTFGPVLPFKGGSLFFILSWAALCFHSEGFLEQGRYEPERHSQRWPVELDVGLIGTCKGGRFSKNLETHFAMSSLCLCISKDSYTMSPTPRLLYAASVPFPAKSTMLALAIYMKIGCGMLYHVLRYTSAM
ncbi:hypothetical protein BT69DRAFT_1337762 [Atractiella rhizophila]|nr:hypothetical protein BT69DRAFT_1337762 [Atractiella rhizophila]